MRDGKQVEAAITETVEKLGPNLFVSVANAGVTQVKPLLECTPEYVHTFQARLATTSLRHSINQSTHAHPRTHFLNRFVENEVRINVLGFMNTHIAAAKQMVKQGSGGRIIGAGSIASYRTAGAFTNRLLLYLLRGILMSIGVPVIRKSWTVRSDEVRRAWVYGGSREGVGGVRYQSERCVVVAIFSLCEFLNGERVAYAPGIVDTPMWDHIDAELAKIVRVLACLPSPLVSPAN